MSFKVPPKTTINNSEYKPEANILPFAPELVDFITKNMKLTTYRFGDKYEYLNVGDIITIQNSTTQKFVHRARITRKSKLTFAELPLDDGNHESYKDKEHQRKVFSGYYKYLGRDIKDDDHFLVISFELIKSTYIDKLAMIIWDYMLMRQQLKKADIIICFGSYDLRSAEWAAKLYLDGYAPKILFSGKQEGNTDGQEAGSEAKLYKTKAMAIGVPASAMLTEDQSTNTGENIQFASRFLEKNAIKPSKVIIVHKPYMERRTYATLQAQWPAPQPEFIMSSLPVSYQDYVSNPGYSKDYILNIMAGDLQRIREYPKLGYQIEQEMPDEVREAFNELIKCGYDKRLIGYAATAP